MDISTWVVGPEAPDTSKWTGSIWVDTVNKQIKEVRSGVWVVLIDLNPSSSTSGYTGEIKHGNSLMTFKDGLLAKYS
jgi:hypothetical protein